MARINQGIFKKLINEYKSIEKEYKQVMGEYFSDGHWNCNGDFFSDFAYSADNIYREANDLAYEIKGMMNTAKFEEKGNEEKYEQMLSASQEIAENIKKAFDDTLKLIIISGGLTAMEQGTLNILAIYSKSNF